MLRASSQLEGVAADVAVAIGDGTGNLPWGGELAGMVAAVVARDRSAAAEARARLADVAGEAAVLDAAAVLANFEMMTRLADSTGARLDATRMEQTAEVRAALGIDRFQSAR